MGMSDYLLDLEDMQDELAQLKEELQAVSAKNAQLESDNMKLQGELLKLKTDVANAVPVGGGHADSGTQQALRQIAGALSVLIDQADGHAANGGYPVWEYRMETVPNNDEAKKKLKILGADGWELVTFITTNGYSGEGIFKRRANPAADLKRRQQWEAEMTRRYGN